MHHFLLDLAVWVYSECLVGRGYYHFPSLYFFFLYKFQKLLFPMLYGWKCLLYSHTIVGITPLQERMILGEMWSHSVVQHIEQNCRSLVKKRKLFIHGQHGLHWAWCCTSIYIFWATEKDGIPPKSVTVYLRPFSSPLLPSLSHSDTHTLTHTCCLRTCTHTHMYNTHTAITGFRCSMRRQLSLYAVSLGAQSSALQA